MCFSLQWLGQILVWLIVICAIVAIIKVILPLVVGQIGGTLGPWANAVIQIIKIVLWAIVAIFIVWFAIDMIQCLLGMAGGLRLPRAG